MKPTSMFSIVRGALRPGLLLLTVGLFSLQPTRAADQDREPGEYDRAMADLASSKDEYHRWVALSRAAKASLAEGREKEAKAFAEEIVKLTPRFAKDWNYGNAVQDYHLVLGRLALKSGDTDAAKKHLLDAGASPGSPQMNSFGPNMTLARDLLAKGEKDVVLEYFTLCRKFWKMGDGKLDEWKKDIEADRSPEFGANLVF